MLDINVDPIGKKPIEVIRNINVQNMSEEVFKMKTGVITREEKIIFPYNKTILIHATPVKIEQKIFGAVIVFSDITELRRLETIRTDFVANVSHELRTPVSNIRGYAETLLDGAIDDKKNAHDFTKIIYNESGRLASLINDILDLSKIESDTFKLNLGQHNLYEIVNKAINKLGKDAGNKNIVVDNVVNKELNFNVDESLLTQVLINLLHNAIKYSHENSKITVSSNIQQGLVTVDVEDQGIGIPERDLPRIFERFYRVDKARSKELGGTGLGLAIVKHIIQVHGGEVSVKSVEGQGSVFSFTIPQKHRR
jgi:two-component system phosphate regulon sensor histidine kinase PhoR